MVASVTLPVNGFVGIHADNNGSPGPVIGATALLQAGTSTNVTATLWDPLTTSMKVYPMAHIDGNNDGKYEFPGPDVPGTTADGQVAAVSISYTVSGSATATATESATSSPEASPTPPKAARPRRRR